jgi:glycosyltransferase involved in cell wall biosynthesis
MKMFEYMAAGRLIVSSDLPVLREVLNVRNAALCPPDDASTWIRALQRAREDEVWRCALGAQARLDVQSYAWEERVQKILGSDI